MVLPLYSENMVLSPTLWRAWDEETQMAYTYYANLHGPEAMRMGMYRIWTKECCKRQI